MSEQIFQGGRLSLANGDELLSKIARAGIYEHHTDPVSVNGEKTHDLFNFERLENRGNIYLLKELAARLSADVDDRINSVAGCGEGSNLMASAVSFLREINFTKVTDRDNANENRDFSGHQPSHGDTYIIFRDVYQSGMTTHYMKKKLEQSGAKVLGVKSVIRVGYGAGDKKELAAVEGVPFQYLFNGSDVMAACKGATL